MQSTNNQAYEFFLAAGRGDIDYCRRQLDDNLVDVDAQFEPGKTALLAAIYKRQTPCVELLISRGANVNLPVSTGTYLETLCLVGDLEYIDLLIKAGANVNAISDLKSIQNCPLRMAVSRGHIRCARKLLSYGADVNLTTSSNFIENATPLITAVWYGQLPCVDLLLDHQANTETWTEILGEPATPLMKACQPCVVDIDDFPRASHDSRVPEEVNVEIIRALLQKGANINAADPKHGMTALMVACRYNMLLCVKALLEAGADVNRVDAYNHSCLFYAADRGNLECVRLVIQAGADKTIVSKRNLYARDFAPRHNNELLELLSV